MNGFIKLHRNLMDDPLWTQCPDAWFRLALAILMKASWKPQKWWDGKREILIPAGSLVTSRDSMSRFARISTQQFRSGLEYLTKTQFCNQRTTNQYTIITITNWETYQGRAGDEQPASNQRITNEQPTDNQRITTSEEGKNTRRKEQTNTSASSMRDEWFATFWEKYPRKIGKKAAEKAFRKAAKSEEDRTAIMAGLARQLPGLQSREERYIPHPASWIQGERWTDEPEKPRVDPQWDNSVAALYR